MNHQQNPTGHFAPPPSLASYSSEYSSPDYSPQPEPWPLPTASPVLLAPSAVAQPRIPFLHGFNSIDDGDDQVARPSTHGHPTSSVLYAASSYNPSNGSDTFAAPGIAPDVPLPSQQYYHQQSQETSTSRTYPALPQHHAPAAQHVHFPLPYAQSSTGSPSVQQHYDPPTPSSTATSYVDPPFTSYYVQFCGTLFPRPNAYNDNATFDRMDKLRDWAGRIRILLKDRRGNKLIVEIPPWETFQAVMVKWCQLFYTSPFQTTWQHDYDRLELKSLKTEVPGTYLKFDMTPWEANVRHTDVIDVIYNDDVPLF